MKYPILIFALAVLSFPAMAQKKFLPQVEILHSGLNTSLRGLSVVNDNVVWVSGSKGMVGKTTNGGKNWRWMTVKGFENSDFRDIEAFDANTAIIMAIAEPAYILKTTDGGESWKVVYENTTKGMFLDAMEFRDRNNGIVIGDPVDGHFFMASTSDAGATWKEFPRSERPAADSGEAFFAASGTNLRYLYNRDLFLVSGGLNSRIFHDGRVAELPLLKGKESTGANSIAVFDTYKKNSGKKLIVVGGDFTRDSLEEGNCYYSNDGGETWKRPNTPPRGYRSCVDFLNKDNIVTCGLSGVDYSLDGGRNFRPISDEGFHVARFARFGTSVYLAGANGKIARLVWPK